MDINLEKIDIIRERTGISYKEAKQILEETGGDVLEALIRLEEREKSWTEEITVKGSELISKIKEVVHAGNVTNIRIKHGDRVIVDIPVTAGAIGAILVPELAVIGTIAGIVTKCTLEIKRKQPDLKEADANNLNNEDQN
jgi:NACalpha-BTF3-like transcription factor